MFERILGAGMLIGLVVRDVFGYARFDHGIMICGSLLAASYLFANWWMTKPNARNLRTVVISILYGLASSALAFALLFKLLYLTGSDEMTIVSFISLGIILGVDLVSSIHKSKVLNSWTMWRLGILSSIVLICYFIPQDYRVAITYRNYPGFLEYYMDKKGNEEFYEIHKNYFNTLNKEELIEI